LSSPRADFPRILGIAEGDRPITLSGIPHFLFAALAKHFPVMRLSYAPTGVSRLALATATFRPSREAWRSRFHNSRLAHGFLSRTLARRAHERHREFDLTLQCLGWVHGQPRPYALYVDQTRTMAERGWPEWMPFSRRERGELLEREREMYGGAEHVFVMGGATGASLTADYGVDPGRVTAVGGGLSYDAMPAATGLSPRPNILFVGRDFERKGGNCLLRAFELVREEMADAELHLVGVRRRIDQEGVVNHGRIFDRARLSELYRQSRAFCLPSLYEPYGLVLIEAMSHGVPCVGTRVEAIPEILDGGRAGLLVPPADVESLAKQLLRLLGDEELARELGAAGRRHVATELTWDHVAERMVPVLSGLTRATTEAPIRS
jgi:starch synthase